MFDNLTPQTPENQLYPGADVGEPIYSPKINIADMIDDDRLQAIGFRCSEGSEQDEGTMQKWLDDLKHGKKLAKQEHQAKSEPFQGAANFKSPIILNACYRAADAISMEILRNKNLQSIKTIGKDQDDVKEKKAENYSIYANWQINDDMEGWRYEFNNMIYQIMMDGCLFKEVYYNPIERRNESKIINAEDVILDNKVKSFWRLRRFGKRMEFSRNEVEEKFRSGVWIENDLFPENKDKDGNDVQVEESDIEFIEQYGYYDLDNDGYEEPYIFTFHVESSKIVRVAPRFEYDEIIYSKKSNEVIKIKPSKSVVQFICLPDIVDGGLMGVGYASILGGFSRAVNQAANDLLNAATSANSPGGVMAKGTSLEGDIESGPGYWHESDLDPERLANAFFPFPIKEPSQTLYQLMGAMVASAEELSSSTNVMAAVGANAPATTTLSLLMEQQQTRSAIVTRIYRSMTDEFKIMFELNSKHTDPEIYQEVVGDDQADYKHDMDLDSFDIVPSANPDVSSKVIRMQQAQAAILLVEQVVVMGGDAKPIIRNYLEVIGMDDVDKIMPESTPDEQLQMLFDSNPDLMNMVMGEKQRADAAQAAQLDALAEDQAREDAKVTQDIKTKEAQEIKYLAEAKLKEEESETEDLKNDVLSVNTAGAIDQASAELDRTKADTDRIMLDNVEKEEKINRGIID